MVQSYDFSSIPALNPIFLLFVSAKLLNPCKKHLHHEVFHFPREVNMLSSSGKKQLSYRAVLARHKKATI